MTTMPNTPPWKNITIVSPTSAAEPKKTKKALQDEIRREKALIKAARKAWFRRKTEKKLAEKAERKVMHKVNNTKRKLEKKLGIPRTGETVPEKGPKKRV